MRNIRFRRPGIQPVSNRKWVFSILIIAVLSICIFAGLKTSDRKNTLESFQSQLSEARYNLDEALKLKGVDDKKARESFYKASEIVEILKSSELSEKEYEDLVNKIEDYKQSLLGISKPSLSEFLNLDLIAKDFKGSGLTLSENDLFVSDNYLKSIIYINIQSEETKEVAGKSFVTDIEQVSSLSEKAIIQNGQGLFQVKGRSLLTIDEKFWWGKSVLSSFGESLYLAEIDNGKIWRYRLEGEGWSEKTLWLKEGETANLTNTIDFAVDGSLWFLKENGDVEKYFAGKYEPFILEESVPKIEKVDVFFLSAETENLYLLEKAKQRIVVFDKEGKYIRQFVFPEAGNTIDFVVSEKENGIFVLVEGKILKAGL